MDIKKHMHRTNVLQAILALWAENEDADLGTVLIEHGLVGPDGGIAPDDQIIEICKANLKPKSQYFMIQVDPQNKPFLGGVDRKLFTAQEYADFMLELNAENNVIFYTTVQYLSEDEVQDVLDAFNKPAITGGSDN